MDPYQQEQRVALIKLLLVLIGLGEERILLKGKRRLHLHTDKYYSFYELLKISSSIHLTVPL